ncbi:hypothetical protein QBC38DRAFT_476481 [Podospora fimiseda]|uniref:DUF1770 domain-containing protein n=1 Tax=Podospora fimiseda TaxID=252190 RepID=A0AAN7BQW9_9PEZI|nr:hypothetical protein QBC38DRAFT_476481 [Podospora fimiseda]
MDTRIPTQIAETIQTAHINTAPSAAHDANPSTAADKKELLYPLEDVVDEIASETETETDEDEEYLYASHLKRRRLRRLRTQLPPMPDLRFEQSYLNSIKNADKWWKIALITIRDHMLMPFAQGILYNLFICGWQHWNRNARIHGSTVGARVRRWWYGVNNWPIPAEKKILKKQ